MKILKIIRKQHTEKEDYTLITFKKWYSKKEFTEKCITPNWNIGTVYAKNGVNIPVELWCVIKAFLRTGDEQHEY